MARKPIVRPEVEVQKAYLDGVAKNLADKLYGPKGPPRGTTLGSYETASAALAKLAEVRVSAKPVERRTLGIGTERCVERDAAADADLALPLVERKATPAGVAAPDLAVVRMDGGRLQIFDRSAVADDTPVPPPSDTPVSPERRGKSWREDKVVLRLSMASNSGGADPCPTRPAHFVDAGRIGQLVKEIKANGRGAASGDTPLPAGDTPRSSGDTPLPPTEYEPPNVVVRSVLATKQKAGRFGELLAAAAWERGFDGSPRRAFWGTGRTPIGACGSGTFRASRRSSTSSTR